jgi:hypothetical protein
MTTPADEQASTSEPEPGVQTPEERRAIAKRAADADIPERDVFAGPTGPSGGTRPPPRDVPTPAPDASAEEERA